MKKKFLRLYIIVVLFMPELMAMPPLAFKNGKFKIVQFTDLHWNSRSVKSQQTLTTMERVMQSETPQLVVLTGDVVTSDPAVQGWNEVIAFFDRMKTPFTVTLGNHDPEVLSLQAIERLLSNSPFYVGAHKAQNAPKGDLTLPVYDSKGGRTVEAALYCLNSNDYPSDDRYGEYDWIHFDQIVWYRNQSERYARAHGGVPLPSLAFFHIPLPEYNQMINRSTTLGISREGGASSPRINSGLFASMVERADVMGVFVGHDHQNESIGMEQGIVLAYGRVTGADAYGELERGGRVIELTEGKAQFDSWVSTPSGRGPIYHYPSGLTSLDEESMNYLTAMEVKPVRQGVAYTYYEGAVKHTDQISKAVKIKEGVMTHIGIEEAVAEDHFAYEFRAWIKIPQRGVYRFYTFSDDGSTLLIDGQPVVDNDGGHSPRRGEGKVALEAGFHELKVLYFEDYMGQRLEVGYSSREIPETCLPDSILFVPNR